MAVIGMGCVRMPLALAFSKKANVIRFDMNADKIELCKLMKPKSRATIPN